MTATHQPAIAADSEYVNVQYFPCGHDHQMLRSEVARLGAGKQLEEIDAGRKADAVIFPRSNCPDCREETKRQERLCVEMDVVLESQRCWTCHATGVPLSGWGPFCSKGCQDTADGAADNRNL